MDSLQQINDELVRFRAWVDEAKDLHADIDETLPEAAKEWLRLAYAIDAKVVPREMATAHSLNKWLHLREDVLASHDLRISVSKVDVCGQVDACGHTVRARSSEFVMRVDGETCSLCQQYQPRAFVEGGCDACPIVQMRGRVCSYSEHRRSEWASWVTDVNPEPMIALLKETLLWELKQRKTDEATSE